MAELDIPQIEADRLIALHKKAANRKTWTFPGPGERVVVPLTSLDGREHFLLDVTRFEIKITKATFQERTHVAVILFRLDVDGPPHRNPDGVEVPCPHLHIYREGFGDKWAVPAPTATFSDTANLYSTLDEFMSHCNIVEPPIVDRGLFS